MKKYLLLLFVPFLVVSCSSDSVDDELPVVKLTSPTDGQVINAGTSVRVAASISDNDELHMVHLHVINLTTGAHAILFEEHPDAKTYALDQSFTVQAGVTYDITIEADDHSGNTGRAHAQVTGR